MLCCVGLFAGFAVGSRLGGPWLFAAPTIGFGLGLIGDIKLMHASHGSHGSLGGGGCCGGGHAHSETNGEDVKDPVCGMKVDEKTTKYVTEFMGKIYYFCSCCLGIYIRYTPNPKKGKRHTKPPSKTSS